MNYLRIKHGDYKTLKKTARREAGLL